MTETPDQAMTGLFRVVLTFRGCPDAADKCPAITDAVDHRVFASGLFNRAEDIVELSITIPPHILGEDDTDLAVALHYALSVTEDAAGLIGSRPEAVQILTPAAFRRLLGEPPEEINALFT